MKTFLLFLFLCASFCVSAQAGGVYVNTGRYQRPPVRYYNYGYGYRGGYWQGNPYWFNQNGGVNVRAGGVNVRVRF